LYFITSLTHSALALSFPASQQIQAAIIDAAGMLLSHAAAVLLLLLIECCDW
jgi:hypothetical protein